MLKPMNVLKANLLSSIKAKQDFLLRNEQLAVFENAVCEVVGRYKIDWGPPLHRWKWRLCRRRPAFCGKT